MRESIIPAGIPMNAYAMKFAALPSCDCQLAKSNCSFTITPSGFCNPVTNAIMKKSANIMIMGKVKFFCPAFSI